MGTEPSSLKLRVLSLTNREDSRRTNKSSRTPLTVSTPRPKSASSTMLTTRETPTKEPLNSRSSTKSPKSLPPDSALSTSSLPKEVDQRRRMIVLNEQSFRAYQHKLVKKKK